MKIVWLGLRELGLGARARGAGACVGWGWGWGYRGVVGGLGWGWGEGNRRDQGLGLVQHHRRKSPRL